MKLSKALSLLSLALPFALAAPSISVQQLESRQDSTDTTDYNSRIIIFALTLEQLVSAFYSSSLALFSADDFRAAGYSDNVREGYEKIGASAQAHVDWLGAELGALGSGGSAGACTYGFPVNTMEQFIDLSEAFQALAVSTYTGAIHKVTTEPFVTAYASMLGVQARYATWISTAVKHRGLDAVSFEAPGSMNTTWSAAGLYVTSCPGGVNPDDILPHNLVNFPFLTVPQDLTSIQPGDTLPFNFVLGATDDPVVVAPGNSLYAAFEVGLDTAVAAVSGDGSVDGAYSVVVPATLGGQGAVWMYVVQSDSAGNAMISDDSIVAGPALMVFGNGGMVQGEQNLWAW